MIHRTVILARRYLPVLVLLLVAASVQPVRAQQRHSMVLRGVPLEDALEKFSEVAGLAVSYPPSLTRGKTSYCVADRLLPEPLLRCILRESKLDYYRLSSGTYVLTERIELPAQMVHLTGRVKDAGTGDPLINANVLVLELGVGAHTTSSGRFTLPGLQPGRYLVRISHVGYHIRQDTLDVSPGDRRFHEIALAPETVFIEPYTVDGSTERLSVGMLGRERIDEESLPAGWGSDAVEPGRALGTLAGVRVNDVTADVHLQGSDAGAHEMRLDGVPIYLPRPLAGIVGPFSSFALKSITVEKAGFDASLGSHLSGIVEAEHRLAARTGMDIQLDPLALNARVQFAGATRNGGQLSILTAGRIGLWGVYPNPELDGLLRSWGRSDEFLLLAPMFRETVTPVIQSADRAANPTGRAPHVGFGDLHFAARYRPDPLRTWNVSAYRGTSAVRSARIDPLRELNTVALPPPLDDAYEWASTAFQARYEAVLNDHLLAGIQVRASNLHQYNQFEIVDSVRTDSLQILSILRKPAANENAVTTLGVEGTFDYSTRHHQLHTGLEVGWTEAYFGLNNVHFKLAMARVESSGTFQDFANGYRADERGLENRAQNVRTAVYATDEITLSRRVRAMPGVRVTYLNSLKTAFVEPRLAFSYHAAEGARYPWSMRTAAGIYRQFVHQQDASVFNVWTMLPAVRLWLPIDGSVRPPLAYHISHSGLLKVGAALEARAELWYKYQAHGLTARYARDPAVGGAAIVADQSAILTGYNGVAHGASITLNGRLKTSRASLTYEYSDATMRSRDLYGGRRMPAYWNVPHRLEVGFEALPIQDVLVSLRGHGQFGRLWALRQVYYDYFGQREPSSIYDGIDLSRPDRHHLPDHYQVDLGIAWTHRAGPRTVQLRLEVLNLLNRKNVADLYLVQKEDALHTEPRYLLGRIPILAVRVGL